MNTSVKKIFLQTVLMFACVGAVLFWGKFLSGAVIASLGATAFIIFAYPKAKASNAEYIIGGYLCGAAAGLIFRLIDSVLAASSANYNYAHILVCAGAAAFTMLLMSLLKLPHPPAAAFAIGVADNAGAFPITASALAGVLFFCVIKRLLKNYLEDLFH